MKIRDKVICKKIRQDGIRHFYLGKTYVVTDIIGDNIEINNYWFLEYGDEDKFHTVPEYFENIRETRKRKLNKIIQLDESCSK